MVYLIRMRELKIGGVYRHFKNHDVKVLAEAYDSETLGKMVVYVLLTNGTIWVRPKKMFLSKVTKNGETFDRFVEVPEEIPVSNK